MMPDTVFIVGVDKAVSEYTAKLTTLIKEQDIDAMSCTLEEYKNMASLSDIIFDGAKFIFMGANLLGQPSMPSISIWQ